MDSLTDLQEKMDFLRQKSHNILQEAGTDLDFSKVEVIPGTVSEKIESFRIMEREMAATAVELEQMKTIKAQMDANEREWRAGQTPVNQPPYGPMESSQFQSRAENLGKMLTQSEEFKQLQRTKSGTASVSLPIPSFKALVTVGSMSPAADRLGTQGMPIEERTVIDMIGTSQTTGNSLEYFEETNVIGEAAVVAEGVAKAEGTEEFTLRTVPIVKMAVWIPITKEALDDVPFLESQIRGRLAFSVARTEEAQVLTGTGAAGPPQLIRGLNNATGIQTQARGADPTPDAIFRAMQKVRGAAGAGFSEPDGVVLHPNDWTDIKLLRAADGTYLWGSPASEAGDFIWGLRVRQTTGQTENTGLVGAFATGAEVYRRENISVVASTEHASFFIENKVALLAESRLGLAIWRPTAFCTVTGI